MIPISLAEICSPSQLLQGWRRIKKNRGRQGMDGFSDPWTIRQKLHRLSQSICRGNYTPSPLMYYPAQVNDKVRTLLLPTLEDRVVQSAISLKLMELIDPLFEDCSFAYRPLRSTQMAQSAVLHWIHRGNTHIIRTDISDCFDSILFPAIQQVLAYFLTDSRLQQLILQFVTVPVLRDNRLYRRTGGIPQGAPLSPLLCNAVLDGYDKSMIQAGCLHIRYADDLVLLAPSSHQVRQSLYATENILGQIGLRINWDKTYETDWRQGFQFLGNSFQQGGVSSWSTTRPSY